MKSIKLFQVAFSLSSLDRSREHAVAIMAQDHHQRHTQMRHGILNAGQGGIIHNLSRCSDDKDISQPLIEDQLWAERYFKLKDRKYRR